MSNYIDEYPEKTAKILKDNAFQIRLSLALIAGVALTGIVLTRIFPDSKPNNTGSNPGTPTQTDRGTITSTR